MAEIIEHDIVSEMKSSYIDYSMSVITGRAIPDIKDGLKPVHRRILYDMWENGMTHDQPFKKVAKIVGSTMGNYHPHGDASIADSIVRMAQNFSMRYPLIDGQGNFGSIDGDSAASMRYIEARLSKIASHLLMDIEKDTIEFVHNYDGSLQEPVVLPGMLPNLLLNGSSGIAVGMATNIPPHNIRDVVSAIVATIDSPDITISDIMKYVPAPDFPTGGTIVGRSGIIQAYETGRGAIILRGKHIIEEQKRHQDIVITEIPYQVNKATLTEKIADLMKEGIIDGVSDIRDESDKDGIRLVLEAKSGYDTGVILNQLYKYTEMQVSFGANLVTLIDGVPKTVSLKTLITEYIKHRENVVVRRTKFELDAAEKRLHILNGLLIALANIDAVVAEIKKADSSAEAKILLVARFDLSDEQAKAILDMKLSRLTSLEAGKIKNEASDLGMLIERLKVILGNRNEVLTIIKSELQRLVSEFGDDRRTDIIESVGSADIEMEAIIPDENVVITITTNGYCKRQPSDAYKLQGRGGKGVIGADMKAEDCIKNVFEASTKDYLLIFTDKGKAHWLKVYEIPEAGKNARGKLISNLMKLDGEKIMSILPVKDFTSGHVMIALKFGDIIKIELSKFDSPRSGGIKAVKLQDGDSVINAVATKENDEIIIVTKMGKSIRFNENIIRSMGRWVGGIRAIKLAGMDEVVALEVVRDGASLLTIASDGIGKRTAIEEYPAQGRGGSGSRAISLVRNFVASALMVMPEDEVLVTSKNGIVIRIPANQIRESGRSTKGVHIMRLKSGDEIAAATLLS